MSTAKGCFWGCFCGLVAGCATIAVAIYFGSGDSAMVWVTGGLVVLTAILVLIAFFNLLMVLQVTWFTGAMERHSDQMRQMKAHELKIPMFWWDKTEKGADDEFPFEGEHDQPLKLEKLYIGIPRGKRRNQPGLIKRLRSALG